MRSIVCCIMLTALALPVRELIADSSAPATQADGAQLWTCDYWQTVRRGDSAGAGEAIRPIELVAPRNGAASGCMVLASRAALRGLKVSTEALATEDGKSRIAADRVVVRYAAPAVPEKSWVRSDRFDALLETPPAEVPVVDVKESRDFKPRVAGPQAMQPSWLTVRVPKDAAAGRYAGKVTVEVAGARPWAVELRLTVSAWTLPDTKDYKVRNLGVLGNERLAAYYGIPAWSDRHFEQMGRSPEQMPDIGCRQVTVNLALHYPAIDNTDTMVRWVKQPDGTFTYDFTVFDRLMDLVDKKMGKPFPLRLNL